MVKALMKFDEYVDQNLLNRLTAIIGDYFPVTSYTPEGSTKTAIIKMFDNDGFGFAIQGYTGTRTKYPNKIGISINNGASYHWSESDIGSSDDRRGKFTIWKYDRGFVISMGNNGSRSGVLVIDVVNKYLLNVTNMSNPFSMITGGRGQLYYKFLTKAGYLVSTSIYSTGYCAPTFGDNSWCPNNNVLEPIMIETDCSGFYVMPYASTFNTVLTDGTDKYFIPFAPIAIKLDK